jgi:hypothetical protein
VRFTGGLRCARLGTLLRLLLADPGLGGARHEVRVLAASMTVPITENVSAISGPAVPLTTNANAYRAAFLDAAYQLFTRVIVAIDGSKFKAVNNRDKNDTVAKVAKRMEQVDASIARYLVA